MRDETTKHTPGPWGITQGTVHPASGGFEIASLSQHYEWGDPQQGANARLIAAAPELLQEAREVLAFLEDVQKGNFTRLDSKGGMPLGTEACVRGLREAISLATTGDSNA